ncbi:MAG: biotin/lipoyl-binding protein [Owenweeksia sp.]|nr:biotin/lipoyl-binding protein [Owenweeksia sp.]
MKKIIIIVISIAAVGLVAFTLIENKEEMKENAKLAQVTTDAIPVELATVEKNSLGAEVAVSGTFSAVSDLSILSETQGQVITIYKKKGERVQKGDLLAQVENDLLQAEVAAAQLQL